jgi:hypothetical protein
VCVVGSAVTLDNHDVQFSADPQWVEVSSFGYQNSYLSSRLQSGLRAFFSARALPSGTYDVRVYFPVFPGQATATTHVVHHAAGNSTVLVNQSLAPPVDFLSLGLFSLRTGQAHGVEIVSGLAGDVAVDAVRFLCIGSA